MSMPQEQQETPLRRASCYVGITKAHYGRWIQYKYNKSTSYVLGIANPWTQYRTEKDSKGEGVFEEVSLPIFKPWHNDPAH